MHPEGKNTEFLACIQPSCCRLKCKFCDLHDVLRWNFRSYVKNKLHFTSMSIISCLVAFCGCLLNLFASFVAFWTDLYIVTCKMINWFWSMLVIMMGPGFEMKNRECGYCKHLALLLGVSNSWADVIGPVDYFHTQSVQTSDYSFGVWAYRHDRLRKTTEWDV